MQLRPYKAEDALEVIRRQAKEPGLTLDAATESLAKAKEQGPALTVVAHGKILGCGGLAMPWPGMAEAWFLCSREVDNLPLLTKIKMIRTAKRVLKKWIKEYKLSRVQVPLREDFPKGVKFAKVLGFTFESVMLKYHQGAGTALMHSIIT